MNDMERDVELIFASLGENEPSHNLVDGIMRRIEAENMKRRAIWHIAIFSNVSLISAVVSLVSWRSAGAELANSGFSQYASLILTDASALASCWDSFLYAAAESFPVASAAALLASVVMFIASSRHLFRDARAILAHQLTA